MLLGKKGIGKKIGWVTFYRNMCHPDHTYSYSFPNLMIGNIIVILLKVSRGNRSTGHHTLIIYQHLGWSINGNPINYELVAHFNGQFRDNSHVHQL